MRSDSCAPPPARPRPLPLPISPPGLRARLNILFSSLSFLLLMPYLTTSLLAGGKAMFARDAAAGAYAAGPFYLAKARSLRKDSSEGAGCTRGTSHSRGESGCYTSSMQRCGVARRGYAHC
jgi:hypothetical protein